MKKYLMAISAIALSLVLAGCTSMMAAAYTDTKAIEEYKHVTGTPENSVVFYGLIVSNTITQFSQMNQDFPPDNQIMRDGIFVSKPVAPGSMYILERVKGDFKTGRVIYYYDETFPMQAAFSPIVIKIPEEPGLYFFGGYHGFELAQGKINEFKNDETEKTCLKGALKLYEGTAWEKIISDRLGEL